MIKKILFFILFFAFISSLAEAKTLYVDQAIGNDSVTYEANSSSNPWRTIGRAAWGSTNRAAPNQSQAAQAGDIVIVKPGTYNAAAASGERYIPAYNPANSGTAGNPIIFRAEGTVYLQSTNGNGPVMGSFGRHYIIWDGFYVDEEYVNTVSDTGPTGIWWANNCQIINCTIKGYARWSADNHNAIRIEGTRNAIVRNNRIYNVYWTSGSHSNCAAIMTYFSEDLLIEHNEIYNSICGIFLKGAGQDPQNRRQTVRYNLIHNVSIGMRIHRVWDSNIYQNVIRNISGDAIQFIGFPDPSPRNIKIVNNTIYGAGLGMYLAFGADQTGNFVHNNIISNMSGHVINANEVSLANISNKGLMQFEHNVYFAFNRHSIIGSTNYTFSSWQTATGQDMVSPASLNTDPLFVNPTVGDFRLQPNSPARNLGRDILNLTGGGTSATIPAGAYITGNEVIGRNVSTSNAPAPPTGLGIQ